MAQRCHAYDVIIAEGVAAGGQEWVKGIMAALAARRLYETEFERPYSPGPDSDFSASTGLEHVDLSCGEI